MTIKPKGSSEVGISTNDLEGWVDFLTLVGGYREIWRGESPDHNKTLWQTPTRETVQECLLGSPHSESGFIRLFQFENIKQEEIRRGTHAWDSGGIYDIDIRVKELIPIVAKMQSLGWEGTRQAIEWQFGPSQVMEWISQGPDAVTIALIQRLAPPLENWDDRQKLSHVFNSAQVVADMDRAMSFYSKLGFIEIVRHNGPMPGRGGEVLGLTPDIPVELVIIHPSGIMEGSIELVKIDGIEGRSVAHRGLPHNLGLNMLRFPVSDLRSYVAQLETDGISPVQGQIISSRIEPFGDTEIMALKTPDGVWLEFYQDFKR